MTPVLGVLGGGQLGRMLALAAARLGVQTRLFDPDPQACGGQVAELVVGSFDDSDALERFCRGLTAATIEFENVPVSAMKKIESVLPIYPAPDTVLMTQDRVAERALLTSAGFNVPESRVVGSLDELTRGCAELGLPSVLKARRLGYDGKGQYWVRESRDIARAWEALGAQPTMLDAGVSFAREISLLAVRGRDGRVVHYPPTENMHRGGILVSSCVPAADTEKTELERARHALSELVERLEYVGVIAVEFFEVDGTLLANEVAPRVHNSGHWTMNGSQTCQFENHVRAVLGLPLGEAAMNPGGNTAAMVNLIGKVPPMDELLAAQGWHVHLYGKAPRPDRKLGHVNWYGPRANLNDSRNMMLELVTRHGTTEHHHV